MFHRLSHSRCGSAKLMMNFHISFTCKCSWKRIGKAWVIVELSVRSPYEWCWCIFSTWNDEVTPISWIYFSLHLKKSLRPKNCEVWFPCLLKGARNMYSWSYFHDLCFLLPLHTCCTTRNHCQLIVFRLFWLIRPLYFNILRLANNLPTQSIDYSAQQ